MNTQSTSSSVRASIAALVLGVFYLTTSYAFYNLNHYKLVVAWGGCALLLLLSTGEIVARKHAASSTIKTLSWPLMLMLLLPLLATLPGLWLTEARYAYFLAQEAGLWLICCAWTLLLSRLLTDPDKFAEFLLALAVIVIAIASLALWRSLSGDIDSGNLLAERESGTFGNANYLACFLVMHIPLFGLCALSSWQSVAAWRHTWYPRLIFVAAAVTALLALFFTQSRVAMATLAMILALVIVGSWWMPSTFPASVRKAGAVLMVLLLATSAAVVVMFPDIAGSLGSSLRSTPESRLVPWRAAWASIQQAPWFGWGPGSSYSLFFQYVDPASRLLWRERSYGHPHNEVLEVLQEGGLLGLIAYLALIAMIAVTAVRTLRSPGLQQDHRIVVLGIVGALIAYHIAGMASVDSRMAVVRLAFFTLLALLFCVQGFAKDASGRAKDAKVQSGNERPFTQASPTLLIAGVLMTASALLLVPDLASRQRFVRIMQQADSAGRVQLLKDLRDANPNVYALEQLVQMEIARGDFQSATTTLDALNELIPNYSISGYFEAVSYLLQGKEQEARAAALQYQARDLYFPENAYLLGKLAVVQNDATSLKEQLRILLTPMLISDIGLRSVDSRSVTIDADNDVTSCVHEQIEGVSRLTLNIEREMFAAVMEQLRATLDGNGIFTETGFGRLVCVGLTNAENAALENGITQTLRLFASPDL